RRDRVRRMRRRRRQARQADLVPASGETQGERGRRVLVRRLQVARAARPHDEESHGRPAPAPHDGPEEAAVRRQADVLGRLQVDRRALTSRKLTGPPSYSLSPIGSIDGGEGWGEGAACQLAETLQHAYGAPPHPTLSPEQGSGERAEASILMA